jgi:hypothetical protein
MDLLWERATESGARRGLQEVLAASEGLTIALRGPSSAPGDDRSSR